MVDKQIIEHFFNKNSGQCGLVFVEDNFESFAKGKIIAIYDTSFLFQMKNGQEIAFSFSRILKVKEVVS